MLYRRSDSEHVLLEWGSSAQTMPREEKEEVFGKKVGEGTGGGGTGEQGEGGAVSQINDQHVHLPRRQHQYKQTVVQSCPFRAQCAGGWLLAVSQAVVDQEWARERAKRANDQRVAVCNLCARR